MHILYICIYICAYVCIYACVYAYICMWRALLQNGLSANPKRLGKELFIYRHIYTYIHAYSICIYMYIHIYIYNRLNRFSNRKRIACISRGNTHECLFCFGYLIFCISPRDVHTTWPTQTVPGARAPTYLPSHHHSCCPLTCGISLVAYSVTVLCHHL